MKSKEEIRNVLRRLHKEICAEELLALSKQLQSRFMSSEIYQKAKNICFYISKSREVSTDFLVQSAQADGKGCYAPVVMGTELQIAPIGEEWSLSSFGIREPKGTHFVPFSEIDVVVVPGLGFDQRGYRIGYGGGYYDRLLANRNSHQTLVGFTLEQWLLDDIHPEVYDQKVDWIITEGRTLLL